MSNTTTQHTPTPWRVGNPSQMGSVVADHPVPEIGGSDAVEYYGGHLIAESIAPRNAAFIVRACNSHLGWAKWIVQRGTDLPDHACAECAPHSDMLVAGFQCVYHEARAALAAAGA